MAASSSAIKYNKAEKTGNAGEGKNLHPGGRKFFFFYRFSGNILFSFLVSFSFFFVFLLCFAFFLACLFFEIKSIYSDTRSTMRAGE